MDTVLLPLCVGLSLLGVILTGLAWRRGNKGRVLQGAGLALAPIALFFTGLLRLVWDGVVAVLDWASKIIFSPGVWFGLSLLGFCVVLWVVGGFIGRRFNEPSGKAAVSSKAADKAVARTGQPAAGKQVAAKKGAASKPDVDPEMAEIEALLKSRGIE